MAGKFILHILGSASAKPSSYRQSSAQLLQAAERLFLIDCSEGTQKRILTQNENLRAWTQKTKEQGVKRLSKNHLDAIFISHIHGDHIFGLFPLLSTMGMNGRRKPLSIYGPNNLGPVLNFYNSFWGERTEFEINFFPLKMKEPEVICEYAGLEVLAFPLNHGIDCFGYLFRETGACEFKKEPYMPRSYAYCSDTSPFGQLPEWVKGVDLLYHEGTYMKEDWRKAQARFHSTNIDAAECARKAGAARLLLGHYSSSIREEQVHSEYLEQARAIFPESCAVDDGDIYEIGMRML